MKHTRRDFFKTASATVVGGAALGGLLLEGHEPGPGSAYHRTLYERWLALGAVPNPEGTLVLTVAARYRSDPERTARIIPPPLEPDPAAEVLLDWAVMIPEPGKVSTFMPGPAYSESDIFVSALHDGHRGMLEVELQIDQDRGRVLGREFQELHKKVGRLAIERSGDRVRAWTTRQGMLLCALETVVTEEPSHPLFWHREHGFGWLNHSYRLAPDWAQGPVDESGALFVGSGRTAGYPSGMAEGDPEAIVQVPRACHPKRTTIDLGVLSPLNPFCEFPVREVIGVSCGMADTRPLMARGRLKVPRSTGERPPAPRTMVAIDAAAMAAWALSMKGYDRPITAGEPWAPPGWPERATALKLTDQELERYRKREAIAIDPATLVDLELEFEPGLHAKTLPPVVAAGDRPLVRILAVRAERSDLALAPFVELWLLARCLLEGRPAWYPLDHVVSADGDVLLARELWGCPSKLGEPEMRVTPLEIAALGRRLHRTFLDLTAPLGLERTPPSEERLELVGIQILVPRREPVARWVASSWTMRIEEGRTVQPSEVVLDLPVEPGPGAIGACDPWFELGGGRMVRAAAGRGAILRHRGRVLRPFASNDEARYLSPRLDGQWMGSFDFNLPGAKPPVQTFKVNDLEVVSKKGT